VVTVADHQPTTIPVDLTGVGGDISGDLGRQRRRQHRPRAVTHQLVEQRPTHRRRSVLLGLVLLLDYFEYGRTFPNQRVNAGS
jgi:hypothetical protein